MRRSSAFSYLLLPVFLVASCSPLYVMRAGWHEAKLLERRVPIDRLVRDTATPPELRSKLRLVLDARDYAERSLGLEPGDSYTSYAEVERDTLMLVVSAAPRFRLEWKTWWFPIVGRVPYRGFFDFEEAREEADELRRRGYDVYVRPTAAFSTLGWLPDPVLSTALAGDSVGIVETVIHEITHSTYFAGGHVDFNESFANFAGHVGAIAFFCDALDQERNCRRARDRWHDTRVFGEFVADVHDRLAALYGRELSDSVRAVRKREVLERAARRYAEEVSPRFRAFGAGRLDPDELNNAWLLARTLYYRRLGDFDAVRRGRSAREAIAAIIEAARAAEDPWTALDRLVSREAVAVR